MKSFLSMLPKCIALIPLLFSSRTQVITIPRNSTMVSEARSRCIGRVSRIRSTTDLFACRPRLVNGYVATAPIPHGQLPVGHVLERFGRWSLHRTLVIHAERREKGDGHGGAPP